MTSYQISPSLLWLAPSMRRMLRLFPVLFVYLFRVLVAGARDAGRFRRSHSMRSRRAMVVSFFLVGVLTSVAAYGANGGVTGVVSNAVTRRNLEGALITLPDLGREVRSDGAGRYLLSDLPPGTHTLVFSYTGLDLRQETVHIVDGQFATLNMDLSSEVYRLETFTVAGEREGNAASITKQRNAENLTEVVALDLYGNVADNNVGNFLKRLPGVAGVGEVGDITGLSIRGAPRSWNAINVDGVRASAAYAGTDDKVGRSVVTDQLSSEFIKEVEVIKALRPDKPADSIGGTVNLVTKSALDIKGTRFTWRAGGTHNAYRSEIGKIYPAGGFTYMTKLGAEESVGLAVTGSYGVVRNARDRIQMGVAANGINNQARTLDDDYVRLRSSGAVKLNFRPRPNVEFWVGVNYSYYSTQQERSDWNIQAANTNIADYAVVSRAQIEAGATPRTTGNAAAGIAPGASAAYTEFLNANFTNTKGHLTRHARNYKGEAGAEFDLPRDQKLRLSLSYNPSEYHFILQRLAAVRTGGFGVALDARGDPYRPDYVQTYGTTIASGADLEKYTTSLMVEDRYAEETMIDGALDYSKVLRGERTETTLKAGANWRRQNRTLNVYAPAWDYVGADGVAGANTATGINDDRLANFLNAAPGYGVFENLYPQRDDFNYERFQRYHQLNPGHFNARASVAATPAFNEITEDVLAVYAMGTTQVGALTLMGGARFEETQVEALGRFTDPKNVGATRIERGGRYDVITPSVHLKYELRKGLIGRASYSTGLTRPAFDALYPNTVVTYDGGSGLGTVTQSNPALDPQFSTNYDVSLEYYLNPAGIVSAGYFRKEVRDFIARDVQVIGQGSDNGFDGQYEGFDLITTRNYGSAKIEGFELNYRQQLHRLPRPFNNVTLSANWTELKSQGYYGNSTLNDELAEFIPRTVNAGLSWGLGRLTVRVQCNYQAGFLNGYNASPEQRIYSTSNQTWDAGVLFNLNQKFGFYLDITNLTNKEPSWYRGNDRNRVTMSEVFGTRIAAGITGRF